MEPLHVSEHVDPSIWNENVCRLGGCCFHTWEWCRYSSEKNKTKPLFFRLGAADSLSKAMAVGFLSMRPIAGIPVQKRLSFGSLPAAADSESRHALVQTLVSYCKSNGYTSLGLNSFGTPFDEPAISEFGFSVSRRYEFLVDISLPYDELWKKIHGKKRNLIRKGMKADLDIKRGSTLEQLLAYRQIAGDTLRRKKRQGIRFPTVEGESHFKLMQKRLVDSGLGRLYLACNNDVPVAGAFFTGFNRKAYYMLSAANETGLKLAAPDLILWTCMTDYQNEGFRLFNLGGLSEAELNGQPLEKSGLYHFKKRFSADVYPCYKGRLVLRPFLDTVYNSARKIKAVLS